MSVLGITLVLWLADVAEAIKPMCILIGGLIALFIAVRAFDYKTVDSYESAWDVVKNSKRWVFCVIFLILLSVVLPTKQTIYLIGGTIAGSEVVNKLSNTQEYEKLMELFNLSLDKKLKELKGEK